MRSDDGRAREPRELAAELGSEPRRACSRRSPSRDELIVRATHVEAPPFDGARWAGRVNDERTRGMRVSTT